MSGSWTFASACLVAGALLGGFLVEGAPASNEAAQVTHVDFLVENLAFGKFKQQASDVEMLSRSMAWTVALFFDVEASDVTDLRGQQEHVFVAAGEMLMPWSKKDWPVARGPGGNRTFLSAALQLPEMSESEVETKIRSEKVKKKLAGDIAETFGDSAAVTGTLRVVAAQAAVVGRPARVTRPATRPASASGSGGSSSDHLQAPPPRPPAPTPVRGGTAPGAQLAARRNGTAPEAQESTAKGSAGPPAEPSNQVPVWEWILLVVGCALCVVGVAMCVREVGRRHTATYRQCFSMSPRNLTWQRKKQVAPKVAKQTSTAGAYLGSLLEKRPLGYTGP